jgi:hypothetical protein
VLRDADSMEAVKAGDHERHNANVLCPFGFWGYRHVLEEPASLPRGRTLPTSIPLSSEGGRVVVGRSLNLEERISEAHIGRLRTSLPGFVLSDCPSLSLLRDGLAPEELHALYFYCHGRRLTDEALDIPTIEIGDQDRIRPSDVNAWFATWPSSHWSRVSPIVFINGCHTAELTPEAIVSFVDSFVLTRASGVIGTEVSLGQAVAGEMAELVLAAIAAGVPVGEAIRNARLALLRKGNLMGLAYTPFCSSSLRFVSPN